MSQTEIAGIEKLRTGILIEIIIPILLLIVSIVYAGLIFTFTVSIPISSTTHPSPPVNRTIFPPITFIIIFIILILITAIIGLIGLLRIRAGFDVLSGMGKDVSIGKTGTTLSLVGLIVTIIGAISLIVIVGLFIIVAGVILDLVGGILIGTGIYKIGEIYNESTTKIGGILSAIPLYILPFIGYIISYVGLGNIKQRLTQPAYTQPIVYQLGQGTLDRNGYAKFQLYSSTNATIVSAIIEGTNIQTSVAIPLQPGNNAIVIYFGNVSSLTLGGIYTINLTINIMGNIQNVKVVIAYQ
ncbi:DUF973 family protein [Saccharolobus shibatae]|uniref:DUF973 family protein n=1 Tax=Saccharolobus shibatae TaxID=2286 RepID=A0A8F5H0C5_9CREN|nr:DUF973 family protein [Saccharolobus shibatae]QXJ35462.1 hypothetical protein J5U22_02009 [Saccharolobus shibatae]